MQNGNQIAKKKIRAKDRHLRRELRPRLKKKDRGIAGRDDAENEGVQAAPGLLKKLPTAKPRFIEPMKARLVDNPPTHGDWLYELKLMAFARLRLRTMRRFP